MKEVVMQENSRTHANRRPSSPVWSTAGTDRVSCAWKDGVGPGFAVGLTEGVARLVSPLGSDNYCR